MRRFLAAFLALSVLWCSDALAHKDRNFPIDEHGKLERIAKEFTPASIVVRASGKQTPEVTITLSGKAVPLPACLARLFVLPVGQKMRAHGSWSHDESSADSLPPYLVIELPKSSDSSERYDRHNLMFNLRTAELMEFWNLDIDMDWSLNPEKELRSLCTKAELGAIPMRSTDKEKRTDKPQDLSEGLMIAISCIVEGVAYWLLGALALVLLFWAYRRRSR